MKNSISYSNSTNTLKREGDCSFEEMPKSKKSQKAVRFQTPDVKESIAALSFSSMLSVPRLRRDFCDILKTHLGSTCPPGSCIGLLENDGISKHRVYAPSEEVLSGGKCHTTLLSILTSSKSQPHAMSGLLTCERLLLAKNLAIAVLQYHATPWMSIIWRSRDIYISDEDGQEDNRRNLNNATLHVNVKIMDRDKNPGKSQKRLFTTNMKIP